MNRDQLELVLTREGLTRPQTRAVLDAADAYATTQARLAIDALGVPWPGVLHRLDLSKPPAMTGCGLPGVNTSRHADVTCELPGCAP
jgi:hypothetical protein